jgi:hypothetical protein
MGTDSSSDRTRRIRELNDALRRSFVGGRVLVTPGVSELWFRRQRQLARNQRNLPCWGRGSPVGDQRLSFAVERSTAVGRWARRSLWSSPSSSENTITHKSYAGGSLDFVGANSPTDLASRPKRIILSDEIDKYPPSARD